MNSACQDVATGIEVLPGQKRTLDVCFGNYDTISSMDSGALVSFSLAPTRVIRRSG
jgi:hypothetical protein